MTRSKKKHSKIYSRIQTREKIVISTKFSKFKFKVLKFEIQVYHQKLHEIMNPMQKESFNLDKHTKRYWISKTETNLKIKTEKKIRKNYGSGDGYVAVFGWLGGVHAKVNQADIRDLIEDVSRFKTSNLHRTIEI